MDSQRPRELAGGLTTIEEKGAWQHPENRPQRALVAGVLDRPRRPPVGLWFMDSSSAAPEMVTLCAAGGSAVHFFRRAGQRDLQPDPPGHQAVRQPAHGADDVRAHRRDVSGLAQGAVRRPGGDKLLECMFRTANGRADRCGSARAIASS